MAKRYRKKNYKQTQINNGSYSNSYSSGDLRENLITSPNQFRNRTTGRIVPGGRPYHVHNGQAMAGARHVDRPHDYYDPYRSIPTTIPGTQPLTTCNSLISLVNSMRCCDEVYYNQGQGHQCCVSMENKFRALYGYDFQYGPNWNDFIVEDIQMIYFNQNYPYEQYPPALGNLRCRPNSFPLSSNCSFCNSMTEVQQNQNQTGPVYGEMDTTGTGGESTWSTVWSEHHGQYLGQHGGHWLSMLSTFCNPDFGPPNNEGISSPTPHWGHCYCKCSYLTDGTTVTPGHFHIPYEFAPHPQCWWDSSLGIGSSNQQGVQQCTPLCESYCGSISSGAEAPEGGY